MELHPNPTLLNVLYWITLVAVIVSTASGVLKAGFRQFDLFGVIIIGLATGLGGGAMRDVLLDRPVFWVANQTFFIASLGAAIAMFIAARYIRMSPRLFLIPDAAGLATFAIAGTLVSLMWQAPWLVASFMGVMTGIMGGILRDILSDDTPVVFQSPLYATVSWSGSLLFIALLEFNVDVALAALISGVAMFSGRMIAIRYNITLPKFRFKG